MSGYAVSYAWPSIVYLVKDTDIKCFVWRGSCVGVVRRRRRDMSESRIKSFKHHGKDAAVGERAVFTPLPIYSHNRWSYSGFLRIQRVSLTRISFSQIYATQYSCYIVYNKLAFSRGCFNLRLRLDEGLVPVSCGLTTEEGLTWHCEQ